MSAWLSIFSGFLQAIADMVRTLGSGVMLGMAYLEMFTKVPAMLEVVVLFIAGFADQETSSGEDSLSLFVKVISLISVSLPLSIPLPSQNPSLGSGLSPLTASDEAASSAPQLDTQMLRSHMITFVYCKHKDVPSQKQGHPDKCATASPARDPSFTSFCVKSKHCLASDSVLVKATKPCESCKKSQKGCCLCLVGSCVCGLLHLINVRGIFFSCLCLANEVLSQLIFCPAMNFCFSLPFLTIFLTLKRLKCCLCLSSRSLPGKKSIIKLFSISALP